MKERIEILLKFANCLFSSFLSLLNFDKMFVRLYVNQNNNIDFQREPWIEV